MSAAQEGLWVWAFDAHAPKIHWPTYDAMFDFIGRNQGQIVGFGYGGDQADNSEISHHNRGKIIFRETGAYAANTQVIDKFLVKPIEALLPTVPRVWIKGNHDHWEDQLVESSPELQGSVERDQLLGLKERGWTVVPTGMEYELGKLSVIHGETLSGNNHAKKAVETYTSSVLYGHFHGPQSYAHVAPFKQRHKHMGWCSPILGQTNPFYLRNKPTNWVNGITIVEVHRTGLFNVYPVIVSNGRFCFGGECYGG